MTNLIKNWNDRAIRIRGDRYVSLTDMAQASGKLFADWNKLKSTKNYLKTLSSVMQISTTDLLQVIQGGDPQNQGTWGHPKVAIRFAQWCSDEMAEYYEVPVETIKTVLLRNREELESDGLKVLKGKALKDVRFIMNLTSDKIPSLTTWTPRSALRGHGVIMDAHQIDLNLGFKVVKA